MRFSLPLGAAALLSLSSAAIAGEFDLTGEIASEVRWFVEDPQFEGQLGGLQPSLTVQPEIRWYHGDDLQQISIVPFARLDGRDHERTHADLREAYWLYAGDEAEVLIGLNQVFWGVTESRHLVNIINQIDQVENIDEEDFLGEPMIHLATQRDFGRFGLFVLPGFRERTFAGEEGRLRAGLPVDEDAAMYESKFEEASTDVALRYAHFLGNWDIGASYFYGTSREARLLPNDDGTALVPFYDQIHQFGLDLQYTEDATLWKFEGIVREGQGTFGALVGGVEYTFFQIFESDADIGVIAEYLHDGRDPAKAPPTAFDNDLFAGARLTLNDIQNSSALAGTVIDLEEGTTSLRLEAERRLGDSVKIEFEAQWFVDAEDDDVLSAVADDSFLTLRLTRFF